LANFGERRKFRKLFRAFNRNTKAKKCAWLWVNCYTQTDIRQSFHFSKFEAKIEKFAWNIFAPLPVCFSWWPSILLLKFRATDI
jgi:hypothetical protein